MSVMSNDHVTLKTPLEPAWWPRADNMLNAGGSGGDGGDGGGG